MLTILFAVWAAALVVSAALLALVIAAQAAAGQVRRLTGSPRPAPVGAAAEA